MLRALWKDWLRTPLICTTAIVLVIAAVIAMLAGDQVLGTLRLILAAVLLQGRDIGARHD